MKNFLLSGAVAALSAVGANAYAQECTVNVGRIVPITGALADVGRETPWVDEHKLRQLDGGVLEIGGQMCSIKYTIYDSRSTAAGSAEAAQVAILDD